MRSKTVSLTLIISLKDTSLLSQSGLFYLTLSVASIYNKPQINCLRGSLWEFQYAQRLIQRVGDLIQNTLGYLQNNDFESFVKFIKHYTSCSRKCNTDVVTLTLKEPSKIAAEDTFILVVFFLLLSFEEKKA